MNISEAGGRFVLVQVEQQKVGDGQIVQPVGHRRVLANAVQGTTEDERPAAVGVEQWLDAQMIARAKKALFWAVPDGEGKVSKQLVHAGFIPDQIGAQNQLHIRGTPGEILVSVRFQSWDQVAAGVHPGVGDDPDPAIEREGLTLVLGFIGSPQQRMAEAGIAVSPDVLRVGTPGSHEAGHPRKQTTVHRRPIEMYDAKDPAH